MSEIAKCPICGESPKLIFYPPGEEVFRHCGVEITHRKTWNQYSAAMGLARFTVAMKTCRAYCPETAYLHAQERVLEVFKCA